MPTPNFNFPTIAQTDTANVPRDLNALANSLDTAFQQTEYQTANVVGTQIRITKPSASNRIFFRLATNINTGSPITVSIDGGTTSKNLVDIDGANVTKLERGFIEVVNTGSFFTYRRTGGITSDELALLAAKIGTPASATDDFNTQLSKFQDGKDLLASNITARGVSAVGTEPLAELADKVGDIVNYPTTGTATVSSASLAFNVYPSGTRGERYITVSSLTFKPSFIIVWNASVNTGYRYTTTYNSQKYISAVANSTIQLITTAGTNPAFCVLESGNAYINSTGFQLPFDADPGVEVNWVAFP